MRFEIEDEATALRDAVQALLATEATPAVVRAGWLGDPGDPGDPGGNTQLPLAVWRKLADGGVLGALVPETDGGLGLDEDSLVPMLEEFGRSGLPVPVVETIAVGAPLLAAAGHPALADVLSGQRLLTAKLDAGGLIPFGQSADLILLRAEDRLRLFERAELELTPVSAVDGSRALARCRPPAAGAGTLITADPTAIDAAWLRGVLGTSALLTGLATRALDLTVDYVKQREQFGVPIGSFQAIKHALASALLALEFARPAGLAAGWAQANDEPDADVSTAMAKVLSSDAAQLVARTAIQCHGAIGYTTEYDLHLYAKRIWALAPSWGDAAFHRDHIGTRLGVLP